VQAGHLFVERKAASGILPELDVGVGKKTINQSNLFS
jgi:hypothetical protein